MRIYGIYDENGDPLCGHWLEDAKGNVRFRRAEGAPHLRAGTRSAARSKAKVALGIRRVRNLPKGAIRKDGLG